MKKKKLIIIISILVLLMLLFPIKTQYKDGGTITYNAILYKVIVWHQLNDQYESGFKTGKQIILFPNNSHALDYYTE